MHAAEVAVRDWIHKTVVGLNLCPFARRPLLQGRVRFVVDEHADPDDVVRRFLQELQHLYETSPAEVETTLLILATACPDFESFLDLVTVGEYLIEEAGLAGEIQLAYFHPRFVYANSDPDDPANAAGRAPFPILHLLREDSVEEARLTYPDIERIPERNAEVLREILATKTQRHEGGTKA